MHSLTPRVLLYLLPGVLANFYSTGNFHIELVNTFNYRLMFLKNVFSRCELNQHLFAGVPISISTTSTLSRGTE